MLYLIDPQNGVADPWSVPLGGVHILDETGRAAILPNELPIVDAYLAAFAKPTPPKHACVRCGATQHAGLVDWMMEGSERNPDGTPMRVGFEWGIASGEGHCRNCGWPARKYHRLIIGGEERFLDFVLQYHPLLIERRRR